MQVIEFTHTGHSAVFGSFSAGDRLRCSADAARHFVEEARCARYADVQPVAAEAPTHSEPPPAAKRAKKA